MVVLLPLVRYTPQYRVVSHHCLDGGQASLARPSSLRKINSNRGTVTIMAPRAHPALSLRRSGNSTDQRPDLAWGRGEGSHSPRGQAEGSVSAHVPTGIPARRAWPAPFFGIPSLFSSILILPNHKSHLQVLGHCPCLQCPSLVRRTPECPHVSPRLCSGPAPLFG